MSIVTLPDLLTSLRRHRLLTAEQLDEMVRQPLGGDSRAVAKELVRRGWLTTFQVNELFLGRGAHLLLKSFVLLESLGEGGMGEVYKARNWKLGQTVALKLIRKERLANESAIKRFYREMVAASKLDHPNIVRAIDADEANGAHFFVMEYVAGIDLNKLVKTEGPLTSARAVDYIRQAALGLQHATERGMVHRDIKPHNLLLTASRPPLTGDVVKILDMGLALVSHDVDGEHSSTMTQEGSVMGTPDYIAPEQGLDAHRVDIRADLYSLGCTLFFLLTGRPIFPGGSMMEKLLKHQQQLPTPVRQVRGDVSPELEAIAAKLLAKRPEERFQTPAELAHALENVASGSSTALPSATSITVPKAPQPVAPNLFEDLRTQETSSITPNLVKPSSAARRARGPALKIGLALGGAFAAVILMVVLWRTVFRSSPPPPVLESPVVVQKPQKKKEKSVIETAADNEQKEREAEIRRQADELVIQKQRETDAEAPFRLLALLAGAPEMAFENLAKEVQEFKVKYGGTPQALKAAELLMELPSPLDRLDPVKIPADVKTAWKASGFDGKDVVGVLGEHRGRHWASVYSVAISADGKTLTSTSTDGVTYLRDAETLHELLALKVGPAPVAFAPEGIIAATGDGHAVLRDVRTGEEVRRWKGYPLALSADRGRLATGHFDSAALVVWDVKTGKELRRFDAAGHSPNCGAFALDGRLVLTGGHDGTLRWWDVGSGKEIRRVTNSGPAPHFWSVAVSPDGRRAVSGDNHQIVRILNAETGAELSRFMMRGGIYSLAFSPDGHHVLSGDQLGTVRLSDAETGKELRRFEGHGSLVKVRSLVFTPDGRRIVSGADDGTVRLWDVATGKEIQPLSGPSGPINTVEFSRDETGILTGETGDRRVWAVGTLTPGKRFGGRSAAIWHAAYLPDGRQGIFAEDGARMELLDLQEGKELRTYAGHQGGITGVAVAPDGQRVLSISSDASVRLWDIANGIELQRFSGHGQAVFGAAFSPDGRWALSASWDDSVRLWNTATGQELRRFEFQKGHAHRVAIAPDGRRAVCGHHSTTITLWDLRADSSTAMFLDPGDAGVIESVNFSPDGKIFASATSLGRVVLWDAAAGAKVRQWQFPGAVKHVAFAADGRHLATANGNGTVYIFRLPKFDHGRLIGVQTKLRDVSFERALLGGGPPKGGDWNTTEVTVRGESITCKVNGPMISAGKLNLHPGPIGFQSEGGERFVSRTSNFSH